MISVICGDALTELNKLPDSSVNCCVTSPPYFGLRDYGVDGQIGLETTVEDYVSKMVTVFSEVRRVLRDDGTLWLNMGDSYASGGAGRSDGGRWIGQPCKVIGGKHDGKRIYRRGDSIGLKQKDLIGIPWRVAFALQADGWYLRSDIIWHKPNPMPESVTDRPTKAHEYIFLLSRSERYYYDAEAIKEPANPKSNMEWGRAGSSGNLVIPGQSASQHRKTRVPAGWDTKEGTHGTIHRDGRSKPQYVEYGNTARNKRTVWTVATKPYPEAHFATYPPELIRPCILAGCPEGGTVLDPFAGSGTTLEVAARCGRNSIGIELNPEYVPLIEKRCHEWIYGQNLFESEAT